MKIYAALLLLPALALGACGQKKAEDDRKASGKVLVGTISDGQLPLDTVSSSPPLMKVSPHDGGGAADASDAAAEDQDPASVDAQQPDVQSVVE
jgi:hypothetical protein